MKRSIISVALAASIALIPFQSESGEAKPKFAPLIIRCVSTVIITVAGGVVTYYVKKWCDSTFSNQNWQLTNEMDNMMGAVGPLWSATSPEQSPTTTTTVQTCEGMGSVWIDNQTVTLTQIPGFVVGVMSTNGVPIATNSVPIHADGETVVLDFRPMLPSVTNKPTAAFFRLLN